MPRALLCGVLLLRCAAASSGGDAEHPPPDLQWVLFLILALLGASLLGIAVWEYATKYHQYYGVKGPEPSKRAGSTSAEQSAAQALHQQLQNSGDSGVRPVIQVAPETTPHLCDAPAIQDPAASSPAQDGDGDSRPLGQGQYTVASIRLLDDREVVVKSFLDTSPDHVEVLKTELALLAQLTHPNLVVVLGITLDPPTVVMEHCPQGSFQQFLRSSNPHLTLSLCMICGALDGMAYLAEQGVVHGFFAARNCFVVNEDPTRFPTLKVADYGLSRRPVIRRSRPQVFEWVRWHPPELLGEAPRPVVESDVYSAGVLLWEALTVGAMPYEDLTAGQAVQAILAGTTLQVPARSPALLTPLLRRCWRLDAAERPPMAEVRREVGAVHQALLLRTPPLAPQRLPDHAPQLPPPLDQPLMVPPSELQFPDTPEAPVGQDATFSRGRTPSPSGAHDISPVQPAFIVQQPAPDSAYPISSSRFAL